MSKIYFDDLVNTVENLVHACSSLTSSCRAALDNALAREDNSVAKFALETIVSNDDLAKRELGMPVRTGKPIHVDGLDGEKFPASFAAVAGALMYASRADEDRSFFGGIFGRIFK